MKNLKYGVLLLMVLVALTAGLFGFLTGCGGGSSGAGSGGGGTMTIQNENPYSLQ